VGRFDVVDVEVGQNMATGRIRRSARRGIAAAVLGWLGVAVFAVLLAPGASAAPSATVEIRNVTPPAVSVDKGGTVTFVNAIPAQNKGGVSIPLVGTFSATVHTDVAVNFFGQNRPLQTGQSTAWTFNDPATTGTITYTYRIVPQAGLAANVANQVVNTVASQLPALPAPTPYVVQTIVQTPPLPSVNLPQLLQVQVQVPPLPGAGGAPVDPNTGVPVPGAPPGTPPGTSPTGGGTVAAPGSGYTYDTGTGAPRMSPSDIGAAAAFDPSRYFVPGSSLGGADRARSGASGGAGGLPGSYDGASVPVFGQLAGLDGSGLDEESAATASNSGATAPALPAAALAAVVALAAVTAALVRTHQASRSTR
jgi:hypothetical protein